MHDPKLPGLVAQAEREGWRQYIRTAADERALVEGCTFSHEHAEHVCTFFETFLHHSKGKQWAGKPFELQPWQRHDLLAPLFGWLRPDGTRRFRAAYVEVPKKNGKTTLATGIALYMLLADGEPAAEVYSAALDKKQASMVFDEAARMVRRSPELTQRCQIVESKKLISVPASFSKYEALSADGENKEGLNWNCLINDELHVWTDREYWASLEDGGAARQQPLMFSITTAGYNRNSICYDQRRYAERILKGELDTDISFFPLIYSAESDDQEAWKTPEAWAKANPSFGVTIYAAEMAEKALKAQELPTEENKFKRRRLNIWTEQEVRLIPMDKWRACKPPLPLDVLRDQECFGGLDLATITDIGAFVMAFPREDDDGHRVPGVDVVCRFWVPKENAIQRAKKDKVPYEVWIREGLITATEGDWIDYGVIRNDLNELAEQYRIREIGYDPWNATQLTTDLIADGFTMVPMRQGMKTMGPPTKELLKLVLAGQLHHGNHPVLDWMATNTAGTTDSNDGVRPDKKKSTEKIDGIVALVMALGRLTCHASSEPGSFYDDNDVEII